MSDINQGLPAPSGQPLGIAPAPGQPPVTPTPATTTPATTPPPAPTTPAPTAPDTTKLQKELDDARLYNRALQSQKDQAEARLRAMAGVPPIVDPMEAKIKQYAQQLDLHPDDARKFLSMVQMENAPLQQRLQQQDAQIQGGNVAQQAMQAAMSANPELFSDPAIQQEVWNNMQQTAQQGNLQALTPEYAKYLGAQVWALKNEPWKQPNLPPVPQPLQGFRPAGLPPISFGGATGQYPPPAAQISNQPNAAQAALAAQMAAYTGIPLAQQ